jgi:hypothetical protein
MRGLEWLARVGPSPLDPWRYAMGWSATAARSHARRLEEFRWLERRPMVRGEGSLFFATRRGVDFLRSPVPPASTPAPTWWAHNSAGAWVAAWYTLRGYSFLGPLELLNSREWFGALEWMDRNDVKQSGHRPDLVGSGPAGTVAFEVELAPKSKARLDAILSLHQDWLLAGWSKRVGYVCGDDQGVRRIKAAARRAAPMMIESKRYRLSCSIGSRSTRRSSLKQLGPPPSHNWKRRLALERVRNSAVHSSHGDHSQDTSDRDPGH